VPADRQARGLRPLLAIAAAGVIAALAALELLLRLVAGGGAGESAQAEAPPPPPGLPELRTVAELRAPNANGVSAGVPHRTDSLGVRGPERPLRPPADVFRITVSGDSFTMGHGVREEDAYPAVLERLLEDPAGAVRFEVINLGISGLNLRYSLERLIRVGLRYEPDLIVYGFTLNDLEGPYYAELPPEEHQRFLDRVDRHRESPSHLLRALWPRLVNLVNALHPIPGSYLYSLDANYNRNPEAWAWFVGDLSKLADVAGHLGVCAQVFVHTHLEQLLGLHPYRALYRRVEEAAEGLGLGVIQSYPRLRWHRAGSLRRSSVDAHPNVAGHRLLAEALHEGLRRLPARCWERRRGR
jgi:lysophospholipase L1-like esterase